MIPSDLTRLLPTTAAAILVVSTLTQLASSHALPRETKTVEVRNLNVMEWPIVATPAPNIISLPAIGGSNNNRNKNNNHNNALQRRQFNTVCGFIGGDPAFPATCLAGSHCAVDVDHGAIGCCGDGGPCTGGIFTGCVDFNSPPQTVLDPYVYTCSGSNVCYKNHFDGGYFQYGCGSASSLATTVVTTVISQVSVQLTATPTLLSEPTTIGSRPATDSSSSSSSSSTTGTTSTETTTGSTTTATTDSSSSSTTGTASSAKSTATPDPAAPSSSGSSSSDTGSIVGGVVGGVAGIAIVAALALWLARRRRNANAQKQYITPSTEKFDDFSSHPYNQNEAGVLAGGVAAHHGAEGELSQLDHEGHTQDPSGIGLAVPIVRDRHRPSDEIPLNREDSRSPEPRSLASPTPDLEEPEPYPPRRRAGNGEGYLWSQTRSQPRSRGRPWV